MSAAICDQVVRPTTPYFPPIWRGGVRLGSYLKESESCPTQLVIESDDELPIDVRRFWVSFPSGMSELAVAKLFGDQRWVIFLEADETVFSDGRTLEECRENLIASAAEDYGILSRYKGKLALHLMKTLDILKTLFPHVDR